MKWGMGHYFFYLEIILDGTVSGPKVKYNVVPTSYGEVRESDPGSQSMSAVDKEHCVL